MIGAKIVDAAVHPHDLAAAGGNSLMHPRPLLESSGDHQFPRGATRGGRRSERA